MTFALEFKAIKLTHEFKHFKGGSWVAFSPLPTSESVSAAAPLDAESQRRNSDPENRASLLMGTCHHGDGSMHMLQVGQICPNVGTSV